MKIYHSKNKYKNRKITINGTTYDSEKEHKRYCELSLLQRAGAITDLQRQVKFLLIPAQYETYERYGKKGKRLKDGKRLLEREVSYIADFVYYENGKKVVEDTKGYKKGTAYDLFTIKRKLMLSVHSIRMREI